MELRVTVSIATALAGFFPPESPVSHDLLSQGFRGFGLTNSDPRNADPNAGKMKRVRAILADAATSNPQAGGQLALHLVQLLQGAGVFRPGSPTAADPEAVRNLRDGLRLQGFSLADDGTIAPMALDGLAGRALTEALRTYVDRARNGIGDRPLVAGTAKDLVEATARHALTERRGTYQEGMPFPGTLHLAFDAVGLGTLDPSVGDEIQSKLDADPAQRLHQCLYLLGLAANRLRNAEGTGHGRPRPASVSTKDARTAIEATGLVSGALLDRLK